MSRVKGYGGPNPLRHAVMGMVGDFAREVAVLIAVFVPLDFALVGRLTAKSIVVTVVVVTQSFAAGVYLEVKR